MKGYKAYSLIAKVNAQPEKRLLVRFRNGVTKLYDCRRILKSPAFEPSRTKDRSAEDEWHVPPLSPIRSSTSRRHP